MQLTWQKIVNIVQYCNWGMWKWKELLKSDCGLASLDTWHSLRWAWVRGKAVELFGQSEVQCKMCINEVQLHIKRGQKQKFWTMNSHRRAKMINKQQQQDCGGRLSVYSTWWCSELHDGNGWSHWKLHRSVGHLCRVTQLWHWFKLIFTSVKALGGF